MFRHAVVFALFITAIVPTAHAQTPVPVGDDFQVNSYTSDIQNYPSVAVSIDGGFVVVWQSNGSPGDDTSSASIQGQRFASDGGALGAQFQINTYTTNGQSLSDVAVDPTGRFVVVWQSNGSSGDDSLGASIQGQRFTSAGAPMAAEVQVNTFTAGNQTSPAVAVAPNGDFVVAWSSTGSVGDDNLSDSVQGQRFASDGSRLGAQLQVNTYTPGSQRSPSLAMDAAGGFVVAWQSDGAPYIGIHGQRFASSGDPLGGEFQVSSYPANQLAPSVAANSSGDFLVAWMSQGSPGDDSDSFSIQGRQFTSSGDPLGAAFQVNAYTTGGQGIPSAAADTDGHFVVTWASGGSAGSDTSAYSIQGRRLASDGEFLGAEFQLNSFTPGAQFAPRVASGSAGDLVAVWESEQSAGDDPNFNVQARRFQIPQRVGDRVWFDTDGNGVQDGGEPGAPDVLVSLYDSGDTLLGQTTTDSNGRYSIFTVAGDVYLDFGLPDGYAFTTRDAGPDDVDSDVNAAGFTSVFFFDAEMPDDSRDAGLVSTEVQVGDFVWVDDDQDGVQDGGEAGVAGVEVRLYREPDPPLLTQSATLVGTTTTDGDGLFQFSTDPGTFYLEFLCPSDGFTALDQGVDDELDSDVEPTTGTTSPFEMMPGTADTSRDAGVLDADSDGVVCSDNCPDDANPGQTDTDGDGSGDPCDLCAGDDAGGDADVDGLCAGSPFECDDADATNACSFVFDDGFESGDLSAWSVTVP